MSDDSRLDWHTAAKDYLIRLGAAEYAQQQRTSRRIKFRYEPSQYHRDLIDQLNRDDEEGFKGLKMLQGYASALGV